MLNHQQSPAGSRLSAAIDKLAHEAADAGMLSRVESAAASARLI